MNNAWRLTMDSEQFSRLRKKLLKTQKQLAELMGTSLKAICSYEQGWRTIPPHIERQMYFLISRSSHAHRNQRNCWEILNCPQHRKENCPTWELSSGKLCWFINGTICNSESQKNWHEKIRICRKCEVMKDII